MPFPAIDASACDAGEKIVQGALYADVDDDAVLTAAGARLY
jgi:hypothetical protein